MNQDTIPTAATSLPTKADYDLAEYASALPAQPPLPYRGYRDLLKSWAGIQGAQASCIGRSVLGDPLWMVEFGNPEATRVSVVIAGIHPIEWIGVETALSLAESVATSFSSERRIVFFPLVNPDGYRKVEANLRAKRRRWVRGNANGVDLNRNWPTHFKKSRGLIARYNTSGPRPCSEPEVAALVSALDTIASRAKMDIALSLHSIGKMILLPWGGVWKSSRHHQQHMRVAKALAQRLRGYRIRQVSHWVPGISFAHGMEIDHLHQAYGATAILVECGLGELASFPSRSLLDPFRIFNPRTPRSEASQIADALKCFVHGDLDV